MQLSKREKQVLSLLAEGGSSKTISTELNITVHTVDTHRRNIIDKLEVFNTPHAVGYAIRNEII